MTTLYSVTASATVLILFGIALRALCARRLPAAFYRAFWITAAARLLIFAEIPSPISIFALFSGNGKNAASAGGTMTGAWHAFVPAAGASSPAPTSDPLFWIRLIYAVGVVLTAAYFLIPHLRFRLQLRNAAVTESAGRRILISSSLKSPCAAGLFRPAICLPKAPAEYESDMLACILAHENAHIRRGDILVKWLFAAALSLHWFNPLVWAMYFLACRDLEFACDDAVVRLWGGDRTARLRYAAILLNLAEDRSASAIAPAMAGSRFTGTKNTAKERILRMIQPKKTSLALVIAAAVLFVCVTAVFAAVPPADAGNAPADGTSARSVPDENNTLIFEDASTPADGVSLIFPLPEDAVWTVTSPFGYVAHIAPQDDDPPFYFLSRIPDPQAKAERTFTLVHNHDGIDLHTEFGTPVLAVADGTVTDAAYSYEKGNYVVLDCGSGITAEYRHLADLSVSVGDTVTEGDVLGRVGQTGNATGVHLHFSLIVDSVPVDPMLYYAPEN